MSARPTPESVKDALRGQIESLAVALFPDGKPEGREWRGRGSDGATWGVVLRGDKVGFWQCFGSGRGGNSPLSLIRDAACAGNHVWAYQWACDFLAGAEPTSPAVPLRQAPPVPTPTEGEGTGKLIYLQGVPFQDWQSPIGAYFIGRGLEPQKFAKPMAGLRFGECWNSDCGRRMAAMLAPVIDPMSRAHIATHRTYLAYRGNSWIKAPIATPKKALGRYKGGIIPLTKGHSNKPLASAPAGDAMLLAEGIENALTVAQWYPELRAAAYIAAGNIGAVRLPPAIERILLVRDRDGMNLSVRESREAAVYAWQSEGRQVAFWDPPPQFHDANDYAAARAAGEWED